MKLLVVIQSLLLIAMSHPAWQKRAAATELNPAPKLAVEWEPLTIDNGSPCLFRVSSQTLLKSLSGRWQGRRIFFNFDARNGAWYGFGGVDIDAVEGLHQLSLEAVTTQGARIFVSHSIPVARADYQTAALSVSRDFTEPDAEALARISREQAFKRQAFRRSAPSRLWIGNFAPPIDSVITDEFGTRRTFNGKVQGAHQGLDLRAETGTPIGAMNNGSVIIAREMFYEGGFVVIDHGQGLLTLYMHLSQINVREGDRVTKRQIVGLSGGTGRTTAPHLHVGIRWQGVYVNPATLLQMRLP